MNKKYILNLGSVLCVLGLAGCAADNTEWVGGLFGGGVAYSVNQITPNKYLLEATAAYTVSSADLINVYKIKANKLCAPRKATYQYQVGSERYMATMTATVSLPKDAPKVTGVVVCK